LSLTLSFSLSVSFLTFTGEIAEDEEYIAGFQLRKFEYLKLLSCILLCKTHLP